MGHYWREMDPIGAAEHDERMSRFSKLRKKIENMQLSDFTVGDLYALCRVMDVLPNKNAREEDLTRLEHKVKKIKKKS